MQITSDSTIRMGFWFVVVPSTDHLGSRAKPDQQLPGHKGSFTPQLLRRPTINHQLPTTMSSSSTSNPGHTDSAKKIANYTQSISTGVTNLLTEIGRVSAASVAAPAVTSGTDGAILLQLQALTGQIVGLSNRMDEIHRMVHGLEKRLDELPSNPSESIWELNNKIHSYTPRCGTPYFAVTRIRCRR